jgi:hypothetical protein
MTRGGRKQRRPSKLPEMGLGFKFRIYGAHANILRQPPYLRGVGGQNKCDGGRRVDDVGGNRGRLGSNTSTSGRQRLASHGAGRGGNPRDVAAYGGR